MLNVLSITLEATHLHDHTYAVKPKGQLGTCGWIGGHPWQVLYVRSHSKAGAVEIVRQSRNLWSQMAR